MMKLNVYAIRDSKTCFMTPVVEMSDAAAIRNFEHAAKQPDSLMFSHSADYDLMKLGTYDNETGVLAPLSPIECLANAAAFQ